MKKAARLGLSPIDTCAWLWSYYYGSRLPGHENRAQKLNEIELRAQLRDPLRIAIRTNGFDYGIVDEILNRRCYEIEVPSPKRILDLGGNIGIASLFFADRFPGAEICTVEPSPLNLAVLEQNIKKNRARVRVVAGAAGNHDGTMTLFSSGDPTQDSATPSGNRTKGSFGVALYSIPTLMKMMGWDHIDLLKIDIEGGEVDVLGGQPEWLNHVEAIVGEGHVGAGYLMEQVRRDLEPKGFRVRLLEERAEAAVLFFAERHSQIGRAAGCGH